jgi:UDP-N-acetylmuramoyl-L-alanyl-D-glutamate--2,6-diaminopimelate ligase
MKLSALLTASGYPEAISQIKEDVEVTEISFDSRAAREGSLFVATRGALNDSHSHIAEAMAHGAVAAVTEYRTADASEEIVLPDTRQALARLSDAMSGHPARALSVVGVTGTNGKTSVASILTHILRSCGKRAGMIGTVGASLDGIPIPRAPADTMTTPDPTVLYPLLARMRDAGCKTVILEATSHASALRKLDPITFDLLIFTNLSHDHLDFHKSMESYFRAKADLFRKARRALVCLDECTGCTGYAERIAEIARQNGGEVRTYARDERKSPDFLLTDFTQSAGRGIEFTVKTKDGSADFRVSSGLLGIYSGMNLLGSVAAARMLGISPACISAAVGSFFGVPGRMERVSLGEDADITVCIDFAHTPDALENLLSAMQELRGKQSRIVTLFGCGGDRDPLKRRDMGRIASCMSDFVYVTSDNSRSENPDGIIKDILKGIDKEKPYRVIPDRKEAIEEAILSAKAGDIILLCGKGHEKYQIDQAGIHPFCESDIARDAFRKRYRQKRENYGGSV